MRIDEAITPGLIKAVSRNGLRRLCDCGFPLPKYPGRYPKSCPVCGEPFEPHDRPPPETDDTEPNVEEPDAAPVGESFDEAARSRFGKPLDKDKRRKFIAVASRLGLDGNGRFETVGHVMASLNSALKEIGFYPDLTLYASTANKEEAVLSVPIRSDEEPETDWKSDVRLSWAKLGDKYEAVAYLT